MASSPVSSRSRCWFVAACVFCSLVSCCKAADEAAPAAFHGQKKDAVDIVGRALFCFNDPHIYSGCQDSLRLGPHGALNVPPASTDAFCGGACLEETELVLRCVDGVMDNFRFYNGASVGDVRQALGRGCGFTGLRGDFDVLQRVGYGGGSRRPVSLVGSLMMMLTAILLRG
ncbi:hypothetical protein QOZ80_1AG0005380 [Eleusine coracana subsp. coracana]|nr:hypothetical protein QOZ80_1AG0005380 [Eleusine coracana subsp. coracana]